MSSSTNAWPVIAGSYEVGDPQGPVAVCALTTESLIAPLVRLPGVAIAGKVYTANLGITRIVLNVTANPAIRFLLICGKDSPLFHPGQSLVALAERGVDADRRIVGAIGYEPVLSTLAPERVAQFRRQVEVVDWAGEEDLRALEEGVGGLVARSPGRFAASDDSAGMLQAEEQFTPIRPGGTREPLQYDPKGYFVITLDREQEQIIIRHYRPDHAPVHEMRGRSAGPMLLGLLREGLVTQLSHAGYLGEELAKAEAALRFDLRYDQDRPLRRREALAATLEATAPAPDSAAPPPMASTMPPMASIMPPLTATELAAATPGMTVNIALAITDLPAPDLLGGELLQADEAEPFGAFRRTEQEVQVRWSPTAQFAMGEAADLQIGALVRVRGTLGESRRIEAERLVILTNVARILEP
jgi:tetrahydromethanopterin S-methyltransferase subunit A